jgi:hypothetical protein
VIFALAVVLLAGVPRASGAPLAAWAPQNLRGWASGDDWEPAIAVDDFGHVHVLWKHYDVPGGGTCTGCDRHAVFQTSSDRGATWTNPVALNTNVNDLQWDSQLVVDPLDGHTLFAAFLNGTANRSDTAVMRSTDAGQTWGPVVVADQRNQSTDHESLAVRGANVAVAYNVSWDTYAAFSTDSGATFAEHLVVPRSANLGWSLPLSGAIDAQGRTYFSWDGFVDSQGVNGPVYLYLTRSSDAGVTWATRVVTSSGGPPTCTNCGWAFYGAQFLIAMDTSGALYGLGSSNLTDFAPNRVWFTRSSDQGDTWSTPQYVSLAPAGTNEVFPVVTAGAPGDVHVAWMDNRVNGQYNLYYRHSSDGGATWSPEDDLATYVAGFPYITPDGFTFPYGDYFEMDLDEQGYAHVIWGEGPSYAGPGNVWYTNNRPPAQTPTPTGTPSPSQTPWPTRTPPPAATNTSTPVPSATPTTPPLARLYLPLALYNAAVR